MIKNIINNNLNKKGKRNSLMIPLFLFSLLLSISFMPSPAISETGIVTVQKTLGDVKIRNTPDGEWNPIKNGSKLNEGWQIKTGEKSEAILVWKQGHVLKIFSFTVLTIENATAGKNAEATAINVDGGKIFSKVKAMKSNNSSFTIKTPTAVAAVRGTEFMVEVSEDSTSKISLLEGKLDVIGEQSQIILEQNNSIEIAKIEETAPAPTQLSPEIKAEMESISTRIDTEINALPPTGDSGSGKNENKNNVDSTAKSTQPEKTGQTDSTAEKTTDIIDQTVKDNVDQIIQNTAVEEAAKIINLPPMPPSDQ